MGNTTDKEKLERLQQQYNLLKDNYRDMEKQKERLYHKLESLSTEYKRLLDKFLRD